MKSWMYAVTLLVAITLYSTTTFSQKPVDQRAKRNVQMLTTKLALTNEQEKTVYTAVLERMTMTDSLRSDTTGGAKPNRKEMKAVNQKFNGIMNSTLTDEQKKKYEAMKAEIAENARKKKEGE